MSTERPPKTVRELQAITGLSAPTVKAAIRTGELPGYKVGRRYVIPADAFDAFREGRWVPKPRPLSSEPIRPLVVSRPTRVA